MSADDEQPVAVVEFVQFLKAFKAAQKAAKSVEREISRVVRPGIALKGEGGNERIDLVIPEIPEEIIIRDPVPWPADQNLREFPVYRVCMSQAAIGNSSNGRILGPPASPDHAAEKK